MIKPHGLNGSEPWVKNGMPSLIDIPLSFCYFYVLVFAFRCVSPSKTSFYVLIIKCSFFDKAFLDYPSMVNGAEREKYHRNSKINAQFCVRRYQRPVEGSKSKNEGSSDRNANQGLLEQCKVYTGAVFNYWERRSLLAELLMKFGQTSKVKIGTINMFQTKNSDCCGCTKQDWSQNYQIIPTDTANTPLVLRVPTKVT
ncbi:hypothetical protein K435DRAFT_806973 [Dendrothele bispora CBS 962.96]|uniref:Uncharacterized protein n=1 Tax=Dendrothele bispora (strain CBS 962.96) TaxID=1314807 RepID=A0A4S8L6T6_DENBC|nr:hypothetical protein K435DRAFT_806973 [Dendrothele bispora CBS 962.96]